VIVIGIDPSVRATAIVAVPLDWGGDWSKVKSKVIVGAKASNMSERIARNERVRIEVSNYLSELMHTTNAGRAYIEDYAYSMVNKSHHLGELGGSIRSALQHPGLISAEEVVASRARKVLLGKLPKNNQKRAVQEALWAAGARFKTIDEYDAMCIANYGLSQQSGFCFIGAQP
jgi:Holliday junction resolvasome RuvABC endonuclease subunit